MSTPADHGFELCSRCRTWRPAAEVRPAVSFGNGETLFVCLDVAWCSNQAGAGQGRLDADTGAP